MGRRIAAALVICAVMLSAIYVSADDTRTDSDKKHMTVLSNLPEITIYCDKYDSSRTEKSDISIQASSGKTKLKNSVTDAYLFDQSDRKEGIAYFIMLDTSASMSGSDNFAKIKNNILKFTKKELDAKDKVFILPFSNKLENGHEKGMNPTTSDIKEALDKVQAAGSNIGTGMYTALGDVCRLAEKTEQDESCPNRKVILLVTDGKEFEGEKTSQEVDLPSSGIGIYAFMEGNYKNYKKALRKSIIEWGGSEYEKVTAKNLKNMEDMLQDSLVIKADIKNVSDMVGRYDVEVYQGNILTAGQSGIRVPNTDGINDAFSITLQKLFLRFWWILFIIAIAVIAFAVLRTIKKNKGIVNIEGKAVYGGNVEKKYHIKGTPQKTVKLSLRIESKSGKASVQQVEFESSMIVGRASICDVYFDDAKMSRQHFAIEEISDALYVQDLESTGGTYLNGVRVFEKQKISSGSIITAGATKIVVEEIIF